MDISTRSSYKELINDLIREMPKNGRGIASRLAKNISVNTTYISQVLSGDKNFSLEQGLKVARFFDFNELEKEYFMLLINKERSGSFELTKFYEEKISKLKVEFQQVKNRVGKSAELTDEEKAVYYSDWKYQAIKLSTDLEDCNNLREISTRIDVPISKLHHIYDFLLKKNLITQHKNKLEMGIAKTHIPASSPLVKHHHVNWRLKAIEELDRLESDELAFTAPLTISKKDFQLVRNEILELIQSISKRVENSKSEEIACLNIDWFKI